MKISSTPRLLIALLIGLIISLLLGRFIYSVETQVIETEFEKDVISEQLAIEQEVALNFLAIKSLKNFYDNSQYVDPNEFKQFASTLLNSHPNIIALSWVPKITATTRADYDSTFSYFERNLHITERGENKQLVPAPQRETYFPVSYIEPITGNENALGFNLASNQKRLAALNLAKESGKLAITASIQLVQDKGVRKSFLAVIPVYTKVEQQAQDIAGYITGVFQISALINNALKNTAEHNINLTLLDLTESEPETLHNTHPEFSFNPGMTVNRDLGLIGGRKWAIKASPARSYILEKRSSNPAIIFILVLTFLTSSIIYIYRLQKQSEITEKAVESRTIELKEAKKELERITLLDEMTGVANRRHFDNYFMQEWKRGLREHPPPDNYCYRYRLFQTIQ